MPAKKKPTKKEESSSSDSSSDDSDSSSSSEEAPAPKVKATAKGKAKAAEKSIEPKAAAEGAEKEGGAEENSDEEDKKPVFTPPPRPVFRPHDKEPPMTGPKDIEYCPDDGLPPDFCKYGPSWDKSQPWCMEHYPHYYPDLAGADLDDAKKKAAAAAEKGKVKELPGGKKKAEAAPSIQIKKLTRGGRKCVTSIAGLELFGVKLDDAAKKFKKKFSCGASVVKGDHGLPDTVDIQGDFEEEATDLICQEFGILRSKFSILEGGTKKKGKGH